MCTYMHVDKYYVSDLQTVTVLMIIGVIIRFVPVYKIYIY